MIRFAALLGLTLAVFKPAYAEPPRIVTDIAPVHSLVSMVMGELGEPALLMPPGVSPHDYALRPSQARNLSRADIVFWIGEALTPGLARSIRSLAVDARSVELLDAEGTFKLSFRTDAVFSHDDEAHDDHKTHHHHQEHKDDSEHDEHDHHAEHKDDSEHEDHNHAEHKDDSEHDHHDHHGTYDPHAWQDPENAKVWLNVIAGVLEKSDPENAATYRRNVQSAVERVDALSSRLKADLQAIGNHSFVVTHDAFHYFENRFGVSAMAAISPNDASPASAARLQAVSREMNADQTICIFIEPQMSKALARTFADEHNAKVGVLDPIGTTFEPGQELYLDMLQGIATGLLDCLR